jgi:hypothetical protein
MTDSIAGPSDVRPLPTEPGWYLDRDGDVWRIDGERRTAIASGYEHLTARSGMTFTRLWAFSDDEVGALVFALSRLVNKDGYSALVARNSDGSASRVDLTDMIAKLGGDA